MYGFKFGNKDSYFFVCSFNKYGFSNNKNVSFSFLYLCLQCGTGKEQIWNFMDFHDKSLEVL